MTLFVARHPELRPVFWAVAVVVNLGMLMMLGVCDTPDSPGGGYDW